MLYKPLVGRGFNRIGPVLKHFFKILMKGINKKLLCVEGCLKFCTFTRIFSEEI